MRDIGEITARRILSLALVIAATTHGALLYGGSYKRSYDAYVHIFFADHYSRDWFSTWEPRWYTGFPITSYPPGSHQLIALLGNVVGLERAFALVQLCGVLLLVAGVYRFAKLWVPQEAAAWAAVLAAVSSSLMEVVHVFGQLPTVLALAALLHALPAIDQWLRHGFIPALLVGVAVLTACTSLHHVTTIFGSIFFLGPVIARAAIDKLHQPRAEEQNFHPPTVTASTFWPLVARRIKRIMPVVTRMALLGLLLGITTLLVILPYWLWSSSDPITQVPIPHASRASFLDDANAGLVFWIVPWGALLILLPYSLFRGLRSTAWPLALSVLLLTLLGTGGTTPVPRLLLRGAYDILTLERFTVWATIAVLPLAGLYVKELFNGSIGNYWRSERLQAATTQMLRVSLASSLILAAWFSSGLTEFRRMQPREIDPEPIVLFLEKDQHSRWRYLMLGFGDQMARVSARTEAATVDGNYHSARRLPELVSRPVERLEGAKFRGIPGIGSLQQFLAVPAKYHLKFVFSNDQFYDPLLWSLGWHRLGLLENRITVWERADVPPLPAVVTGRELPAAQRLLWGLAPIASIIAALMMCAWRQQRYYLPRGAIVRLRSCGLDVNASAFQTWPGFAHTALGKQSAKLSPCSPAKARVGTRRTRHDTVQNFATARFFAASIAALVIALLTAILLWNTAAHIRTTDSPEQSVTAYYEDLDFRRYTAAWNRLDPLLRPSLDLYLLDLSRRDGLLDSYSSLDAVEVLDVNVTGERATVTVAVLYVTALEEYALTRTHRLTRNGDRWSIEPDLPDRWAPAVELIRQPEVNYLQFGRRLVTTGTTRYGDVLDRPRISLTEPIAWRSDDGWNIVGSATNLDVDPADLTITADLLDFAGRTLATYDAAQIVMHTLMPGEQTPYRIDFEGTAGVQDLRDPGAGDFRPQSRSPLALNDEVASIELSVKAVVATQDLDRLTLENLEIRRDESGAMWLEGRVYNDGPRTATVPHLVIAQTNEAGSVTWVDQHYLSRAIAPQTRAEFLIPVSPPNQLQADLPIRTFDSAGARRSATPQALPWVLPTPDSSEIAAVWITVNGYFRNEQP